MTLVEIFLKEKEELGLQLTSSSLYGVHLRTKIIENKRRFEVQKLDYPCRNLVI